MKNFLSAVSNYLKRSDTYLLTLCLLASAYGIVLISSATRYMETSKYIYVQIFATVLGVALFVLFSVLDVDILAERWRTLLVFSLLFIATLFFFGKDDNTGNKAWLRFGSIGIQPSEIVKIFFIIIVAYLMTHFRRTRGISHPAAIGGMLLVFAAFFGLIVVASSDLGSALVYFFIFAVMLFVGGVKIYWFLIALGGLAALSPLAWLFFLTDRQKQRILAPYDPTIDPTGQGIKWQTNRSKMALASGQVFGTGLGKGPQTQVGGVPKQHTDFIFAVSGEELGLVGCVVIVVLLLLIIIRCIQVGIRANDSLGSLVCIGIAAMLIFQTFENIGMCIGVAPVVGLTLPFFSYGGSSVVTTYAAMGIVSGVKMKPKPTMFTQYY